MQARRRLGSVACHDRRPLSHRALLRRAPGRRARGLDRRRGRARRRLPPARRPHERRPVAARHGQPAGHRRARALVPRAGERDEPDRPPRPERWQADRLEVRHRGAAGRRRGRQGATRRVRRLPAHAAGRGRVEQGPVDGLPDGRPRREPGRPLGRGRGGDHRRGEGARRGGRPGRPDGRAARPEGLPARHGVERARRDHRRDGDPRLHLRHDHGDARADPHGDRRAGDDARDRPDARSRPDRAEHRADARDDDRARRRHRLRALHRHPSLPRPRRRPPDARVGRTRDGDLGRRGLLRGLHGDDRARLARSRRSRSSRRWASWPPSPSSSRCSPP